MNVLDQFEVNFNNLSTISAKEDALESLLNSDLDFSNEEIRDKIKEYKEQLLDFKEAIEIETDNIISDEIENRKYKLYTCVNDIDEYVAGVNYYVFIDDVASYYRSIGVDSINADLSGYIENIKPIVWIIVDNGIGTLKRKNIFNGNFSKYFTEFVF